MKPLTSLSSSARASGRRDFLAWLAVAPAVAGCTVAARDDDPAPNGATTDEALPANDGHDGDDGDVAMTEEAWHSCSTPTTRDAEGPYFEAGAPVRSLRIAGTNEPGVRLVVEGRLVGPDCRALAGYGVDIWQADTAGNYYEGATSAFRLRGKIVSDRYGRYRFETVLPGRYGDAAGIRPAHIHAKILTPQGNTLLTTQLYFAGDPYLGQADYCTRSRYCNSADPKRALVLTDATVSSTAGKRARFDAYLSRS